MHRKHGRKRKKLEFCDLTLCIKNDEIRPGTSDGSGTEKVGFGRVREFPKFEKSGSGMSGIEKTRVRAGIFGFGNSRTHH